MLTYDAVIATRNRPKALALSIPLLMAQSRPPKSVVVVDSSDDPSGTEDVIRKCALKSGTPIRVIRSEPGTSTQRNVGLKYVDADVTVFPDDDSLLFPDALAAIMRIYERDTDGVVGGVCGADEGALPIEVGEGKREYQVKKGDAMRQVIAKARYRVEDSLFQDPFKTFARERYALRSPPSWLAAENSVLVEWMTGYRMSFRTALIRRVGFDESLGRYALFEDVDASFGVLREQFLVGARNARIHHYKFPEARDAGRALGVMQILNRAYVLAKTDVLTERVIRNLYRFSQYKLMQYAAGAVSQAGRARLQGAFEAYRKVPALLGANDVRSAYLDLRSALLDDQ